ncbi:MAG: hypothetical protein JWN95_1517 [Frankiales bacterium]|nr:hypothetical protein [Frankiales bacterium]
MAGTTAQAFTDFMEAITITEYQKTSIVGGRKAGIARDLGEAFPASSDLPLVEVRLMGSAAKGTIIRPIDDVDVVAIFSNVKDAWRDKYQYDSQAFLYRIKRAYDGYSVAQVGARGQAVRVFYDGGGHVDVAPVFIKGDGVYHLPSGTGGWILTAPFIANDWFAGRNRDLDYHLAPLVRMLKKWNLAHSKRLQSFHLETIAAHTFSSVSGNRRVGLQKFFEWGGTHLSVKDPGEQSGQLNDYLSWQDEQEIKTSFVAASNRALRAIEAEASGDHDEAKRLWRIILGSSFPS